MLNGMQAFPNGDHSGVVVFSSPGNFTWAPPSIFNQMIVEVWGAGGAGGDASSAYATGFGGQGGFYTSWSIPFGSLLSVENIIIGKGGSQNYRPGGYSVFGGYAWSRGGFGGIDNGSGSFYAAPEYSPTVTRSFTRMTDEWGGNPGYPGALNGTNGVNSGGGGGAYYNSYNQWGYGGASTGGGRGGNGGASGIGGAPVNGANPGGGGGAYNTSTSPNVVGSGGDGQIKITWS